jgi:hypothetical protein
MKVYSKEFKADAVALYVSDPTATRNTVAKLSICRAIRQLCGYADAPSWILCGQSAHQIPEFIQDWWTSDRVQVCPALRDPPAMPGEQGARCHDPMELKRRRGPALPTLAANE